MKIIYTLIKLVVLLALLLLAISNTQTITFNYLPGQMVNLPLIALLLIFFIIGTVFGVFSMFGRLLSLRNQIARLQSLFKKEQNKNGQLSAQLIHANDYSASSNMVSPDQTVEQKVSK